MSVLISISIVLSSFLLNINNDVYADEYFLGSGSAADPFQIGSIDQLNTLATLINSGNTNYISSNYLLIEDLDLVAQTNWTPIGVSQVYSFKGVFDGNNKTISNLNIQKSVLSQDSQYQGLFGVNYGTIKNINISTDTSLSGSITVYFGSIVARNEQSGIVDNCHVSGEIRSGILNNSNGVFLGGIVGSNGGKITKCSNSSAIYGANTNGGIAAVVTSVAQFYWEAGSIENCYNTGELNGNVNGGIVGSTSGSITKCYNTGAISGSTVGGIAASTNANISNCYNTGAVFGSTSATGGIVGSCEYSLFYQGSAFQCYNVGLVGYIGDPKTFGAIVGNNYNSVGTCYFKNNVNSGVGYDGSKYGQAVSTTKLSDIELTQQSSFVGFDFTYIWQMPSSNKLYLSPILKSNPQQLEDDYVESISISQLPTKTQYIIGEELDLTGGALTATYKSGISVTNDLNSSMISGFNNLQVGEQIITLSYEGKHTTFKLNVADIEKSVDSNIDLECLALCQMTYTDLTHHKNDSIPLILWTNQYSGYDSSYSETGLNDLIWKNDIESKYKDFYKQLIGDYYVRDIFDDEQGKYQKNKTGFYAVTYENNENIVICFRGSSDVADWTKTNLEFVLNGELSYQFDLALQYYKIISNYYKNKKIIVTGHSLGGALASYVSLLTGVKSVAFNGASGYIIDDTYYSKSSQSEAFKIFRGVDKWNFRNLITQNGVSINSFIANVNQEKYFTELYKDREVDVFGDKTDLYIPFFDIYIGEIYLNHSTMTIVDYKSNYKFTEMLDSNVLIPSSNPIIFNSNESLLFLGTSAENKINDLGYILSKENKSLTSVLVGGDGNDYIKSSNNNNILAGGVGNDVLEGSDNNDSYYYFKGDNYDKIIDMGGNDKLVLSDFDVNDSIAIVNSTSQKCYFVNINDKPIIEISKNRNSNPLNSFIVEFNGKSTNLQDWIKWDKSRKITVACPVIVEIYDENENLIKTLSNNSEYSEYTDYGYFRVYKEPTGENFIKVVNLFNNNYSIKLIGTGAGTMKYSIEEVNSDGQHITYSVNNVPITITTVISTSTNLLQPPVLSIKSSSDSEITELTLTKTVASLQNPNTQEITVQQKRNSSSKTESKVINAKNGASVDDLSYLVAIPEQWMKTTKAVEFWLNSTTVTSQSNQSIKNYSYIKRAKALLKTVQSTLLSAMQVDLMQRVTTINNNVSETVVNQEYVRGNFTIRLPIPDSLLMTKNLGVVYIEEATGLTANLASKIVTIDNVKYIEFQNNRSAVYGFVSDKNNAAVIG